MNAKKQIIAVDIDDVLAASAEIFIAYSNEHHGTKLSVEQYVEDWGKLWPVDLEELYRRRDHFFSIDDVSRREIKQDAVRVLTHLKDKYELIAITSRPKHLVE